MRRMISTMSTLLLGREGWLGWLLELLELDELLLEEELLEDEELEDELLEEDDDGLEEEELELLGLPEDELCDWLCCPGMGLS